MRNIYKAKFVPPCIAIISLFIAASQLSAATAKSKSVFYVGEIICGLQGKEFVPGELKAKRFISLSKTLKGLRQILKRAEKKEKARIRKRIVVLATKHETELPICAPGPEAVRIDISQAVAVVLEGTTQATVSASNKISGSSNIAKIDSGANLTEALLTGSLNAGSMTSFGSQLYIAAATGSPMALNPKNKACVLAVVNKASLFPTCLDNPNNTELVFSNFIGGPTRPTNGFYYWMREPGDTGAERRTLKYLDGTTSVGVYSDSTAYKSGSGNFVVGAHPLNIYIHALDNFTSKNSIVEMENGTIKRLLSADAGSLLYTFGDNKLYSDKVTGVEQLTPGDTVTVKNWTGSTASTPLGGECSLFPVEQDGHNYCGVYPANAAANPSTIYFYNGAAYASTGSSGTIVYQLYPSVQALKTSVTDTDYFSGLNNLIFIGGKTASAEPRLVIYDLTSSTETILGVPEVGGYVSEIESISSSFGVLLLSHTTPPGAGANDPTFVKLFRISPQGEISLIKDYQTDNIRGLSSLVSG